MNLPCTHKLISVWKFFTHINAIETINWLEGGSRLKDIKLERGGEVYNDLSRKQLHIKVCIDAAMASWIVADVVVSTLTQN